MSIETSLESTKESPNSIVRVWGVYIARRIIYENSLMVKVNDLPYANFDSLARPTCSKLTCVGSFIRVMCFIFLSTSSEPS